MHTLLTSEAGKERLAEFDRLHKGGAIPYQAVPFRVHRKGYPLALFLAIIKASKQNCPPKHSRKTTMGKPYLTPRQTEIVRLISLGCTNQEIADILGIAVSTVDNHRSRAMAELGTDKMVLLTRLAIKHRISSMRDKLTLTEKRRSGRKQDGWN